MEEIGNNIRTFSEGDWGRIRLIPGVAIRGHYCIMFPKSSTFLLQTDDEGDGIKDEEEEEEEGFVRVERWSGQPWRSGRPPAPTNIYSYVHPSPVPQLILFQWDAPFLLDAMRVYVRIRLFLLIDLWIHTLCAFLFFYKCITP